MVRLRKSNNRNQNQDFHLKFYLCDWWDVLHKNFKSITGLKRPFLLNTKTSYNRNQIDQHRNNVH